MCNILIAVVRYFRANSFPFCGVCTTGEKNTISLDIISDRCFVLLFFIQLFHISMVIKFFFFCRVNHLKKEKVMYYIVHKVFIKVNH